MNALPETPKPRKLDRLSALISHLRVHARLVSSEDPREGKANFLIFRNQGGAIRLAYVPRHQDLPDTVGKSDRGGALGDPDRSKSSACQAVGVRDGETIVVSAEIELSGVGPHLVLALPRCLSICLDEAPDLACVVHPLAEEVITPRCGGMAVFLRLCEVVVIRLLRHAIEGGNANAGLLAGLAHPRLAYALVAVHDNPGRAWSLEDLADVAGMSRTQFAVTFREVLGISPGAYLSEWRLALARIALLRGDQVKSVARACGFSSSASFSRAFSKKFGETPSRLRSRVSAGGQESGSANGEEMDRSLLSAPGERAPISAAL